MLKKCCLAFTALLTIISILIFYTNTAFSQQLSFLNSNKKLSENYSPGRLYYSEDKYNTLLANLLFKKNYTTVNNYINPGHVNGDYLDIYKDKNGIYYKHKGIDFKAGTGIVVYSPVSGIVIKPANNFDENFGCVMIYDPIHDMTFNFQHLSNRYVYEGKVVEIGDPIGESGSKGADGPHLHVGLRAGNQTFDESLYAQPTNSYDPRIVLDFYYFSTEYYNNTNLSGSPVLTHTENRIDYDWAGGSLGSGVNSDNFSVRWTGEFYNQDGDFRFYAIADDGLRLWIDDNLIINCWWDQAPTQYSSTIHLGSGVHTIKCEYYENYGGAFAKVWWEKINNSNNQLRILEAKYGINSSFINVTDKLNSSISNNQLNIQVTNEFFGNDPAYGIRKVVEVKYMNNNGVFYLRVNEGDTLFINSYTTDSRSLPEGSSTQGISLFEHINYEGYKMDVSQDISNLHNTTINGDTVSSIKVPQGVVVTLYEHINFEGRYEVFRGDDSDFRNNHIGNDTVSSIRFGDYSNR